MFQQAVNRVTPAGPPEAYVSWRALVPRATHFRAAGCEEYGCSHWANGWVTILPTGDNRCDWIRAHSGRAYTETVEDGLTRFVFPAGQTCFDAANHVVPLERPVVFRRERGDWRRRADPVTYDRPDQWVDDMATHLDKLPH